MDVEPHVREEKTTVTVLVTGANSGLGFAICCRLIDEFLFTRPQSQTLHLLYSTRDSKKGEDTLKRLNAHLQTTLRRANGKAAVGISLLLEARIKLEGVLVDLTKLLTVKALAKQLLARGQHLDAVVWNAGVAGWTGINWLKAAWEILTRFSQATTYPHFMGCDVGALTKRQVGGYGNVHMFPEPRLGQVFCANVFGHYMLTHWLSPLMGAESRVVWISSLSATPDLFSLEDIQAIEAEMAYESSKRLTDLLVLTAELPSTQSYTRPFFNQPPSRATSTKPDSARAPQMYITHPGVVATSIADLNAFLAFGMIAFMYIARWIGSPWHPITPYKGAVSAAFAVLAPPSQLSDLEAREGKGKWGSAADVFGDERVVRTEIEGWGFGGEPGSPAPSGSISSRRREYKGPATKDSREEFEEAGRRCWREMEELRVEWEKRLGRVEIDAGASADV
ncbi:3-keto-steroid reductase [Vermiconidia calcicola]|uniref:3-keto-steroid reductase n=1 Tax=Vermiconidia calcicola TaxID=1690605 RepID=A0ACC3N148_9PEZI|nr:3-keto-steroid reductase [Vermiconidia calcicola]